MPQIPVHNIQGERVADVQVPDAVLGLPYNADLVHQAVLTVDKRRKRRAGTVKTRAQVRATSAKWYRQKGLGRARHGARSAPIFVGGGVAHGPPGVQMRAKMPKRMRRAALYTALSQRVREGAVTVVDELTLGGISTKRFVAALNHLDLYGRLLMILSADEAADEVLHKSSRNVPDIATRAVPHFNTRDIVWAEDILITKAALAQMAEGGLADAD